LATARMKARPLGVPIPVTTGAGGQGRVGAKGEIEEGAETKVPECAVELGGCSQGDPHQHTKGAGVHQCFMSSSSNPPSGQKPERHTEKLAERPTGTTRGRPSVLISVCASLSFGEGAVEPGLRD
jgi:hypothetical protein